MRGLSPMPCPEALDRFAVYLDDELETQDGRSLESHLSVCDSCLARARDLAEVHRDLALRSSREEMKSRDPIPAMMARVRWTAAVSRRMRRSRPAESIDPRLLWILVPVAAALLLALFGVDRTPSPRKTPKVEPSPLVEIPPPNIETPAPAPRIAAPSAPDPRTVTPLPRVAVDPPVEAPEPTPKREPAPIVPSTTVPVAPAAIARLEREGRPPRPIALGDTLAEDAPVVVVYPDGMRLFVARDTTLAFEGRGKTVSIARGEVFADVVPQPPEEPVMFSTAGAEVKVVGTWLSVAARPEATVVSVERGRVQVTRKSDRWSLGLREGFTVSVEAGRLPQARPIPSNLLADPGFEAEGKGWEGVFNRLMGRNFGGVSLAPDVFHSGGRSLQLTTQPTFGYDREVYQDFPVAAGDGFEAAGWVRTAGIGVNGVKLSLLWLGTSGSLANDPSTTIRGRGLVVREDVAGIRTGTTEWTRLSTRAAAPPQAKQVRLQIYADVDPGGPATAWVDDLILRRVQKGK